MFTRSGHLYAAQQLRPENAATADLGWLDPHPAPVLGDGRLADAALAAEMLAEWYDLSGGVITFRRTGLRWGYLSDQTCLPGYRRPSAESADVTAVYLHSTARARSAGHPVVLPGAPGAAGLLDAAVLLADASAVLLAALDRYLVGSADLAAWYLSSPCDLRFCRYHGGGEAAAGAGRVVEPLDAGTIAPLYWVPGSGAVPVTSSQWPDFALTRSPECHLRLTSPAVADDVHQAA